MDEMRDTNAKIATGGGSYIEVRKKGNVKAYVLNVAEYQDIDHVTEVDMPVTSVTGLKKELLSVDHYFNVLLRQPDYKGGVSEALRSIAR